MRRVPLRACCRAWLTAHCCPVEPHVHPAGAQARTHSCGGTGMPTPSGCALQSLVNREVLPARPFHGPAQEAVLHRHTLACRSKPYMSVQSTCRRLLTTMQKGTGPGLLTSLILAAWCVQGAVQAVQFSPASPAILLTAGEDGTARLCDCRNADGPSAQAIELGPPLTALACKDTLACLAIGTAGAHTPS